MANKRQKEARKRFKAANPHLFPPAEPPKDPSSKKKKKRKKALGVRKSQKDTKRAGGAKSSLRKHPLRVPGMKPGDSCFICRSPDHIAKLCPKKSEWEKNKICLLCRRRGHSLKNCPEKTEADDKKHCYNCGEMGHSLSKCPQPLQDGGTKFASCFICNEQGHLSKNCPKNAHGIYPKGGSCKTCGAVTHLAKDCPKKGAKDSLSTTGMNSNSKQEKRWQGKLTILRSGDDLEDDFIMDAEQTDKKANKQEKSWQGKLAILPSGDDLDDDFIMDAEQTDKKGKKLKSLADTDSFGANTETPDAIKSKRKMRTKVVNFVG